MYIVFIETQNMYAGKPIVFFLLIVHPYHLFWCGKPLLMLFYAENSQELYISEWIL